MAGFTLPLLDEVYSDYPYEYEQGFEFPTVEEFLAETVYYERVVDFSQSSPWGMVFQFFMVVLALLFVIFLAYVSLRLVGGAKNIRKGGNLKTIEAVPVGNQSTIQLVHACGKYFLIGVSRAGITFISEIPADDVQLEEKPLIVAPFDKYLAKFFKRGQSNNDEEE